MTGKGKISEDAVHGDTTENATHSQQTIELYYVVIVFCVGRITAQCSSIVNGCFYKPGQIEMARHNIRPYSDLTLKDQNCNENYMQVSAHNVTSFVAHCSLCAAKISVRQRP